MEMYKYTKAKVLARAQSTEKRKREKRLPDIDNVDAEFFVVEVGALVGWLVTPSVVELLVDDPDISTLLTAVVEVHVEVYADVDAGSITVAVVDVTARLLIYIVMSIATIFTGRG